MKWDEGVHFLQTQGFNLVAVFACTELSPAIIETMEAQAISLTSYARLVLIGNGGPAFWHALQAYGMQNDNPGNPDDSDDPVDQFSEATTQHLIAHYLDQAPSLMLYPKPFSIPLQQIGALAGWHHPSPLGIGIHADFGLWFAYRAAFLTQAALPLTTREPSSSPCDSCITKPCINNCPAHAVADGQPFDIPKCLQYRTQPNSPCIDRCFARLACPVAPMHQYPLEQIQYHYRHSMQSIQQYI